MALCSYKYNITLLQKVTVGQIQVLLLCDAAFSRFHDLLIFISLFRVISFC